MTVGTYKFNHTTFYRPQIMGRTYLKPGFHGHSKIVSHLPARIKPKADFVITDMEKGSFRVFEIKSSVGRVGVRRISSYLRMPFMAGGHYIFRPETDVHHGGILVHEGIETPPELAKVAWPIETSYPNRALVETLLGSKGMSAVEQVLSVVKSLAQEMGWPLDRVEIRFVRDPEVEDWEYVLVLLVFACDFETADRHLRELYAQIDMLIDKLGDEEQQILQRMIFFDIKTKASIFSA